MKAIDYSAFSTGNVAVPVETLHRIRLLSPNDMLLNIPGAWHGATAYDAARQSIRNGREAGFTHSASYTVLNMRPGRESVERAQAAIGDEWDNLSFLAIDVELETTPDIVAEAFDTAINMGARPVMYTAKWAWDQFMASTNAFGQWELWNAFYDNDPDLDFANHPFGSWPVTKLAGEQYTNTTEVDGIGFDFNQFDDAWVNGKPLSPAGGLQALVKAWQDSMIDLTVGQASLIQDPFNMVRLALHSIYVSRRTSDWKALLEPGK